MRERKQGVPTDKFLVSFELLLSHNNWTEPSRSFKNSEATERVSHEEEGEGNTQGCT